MQTVAQTEQVRGRRLAGLDQGAHELELRMHDEDGQRHRHEREHEALEHGAKRQDRPEEVGVEDGPDRADDQVQRHADDPARPYARMRQRHASERADDVDEGDARQDERPGHGLPGDGARHAGDNRLPVGDIADHVRLSGALPRVRRPIANRPASTPAARSAVRAPHERRAGAHDARLGVSIETAVRSMILIGGSAQDAASVTGRFR